MADRGRKNADSALVAALACGATARDAARTTGVAERTIYRRLDDPTFTAQIDAARTEMIARAVGRLAETSTEAADTLRALLTASAETVRLGAARSILELAIKLREHDELVSRIEALEASLSKGGAGWKPRTA